MTSYFARVFISRGGSVHGPYSLYNLRSELSLLGEFEPSDMAWHEGAVSWLPLREVVQISSRLRLRVRRWILGPAFLGVGAFAAVIASIMLDAYWKGELRAEPAGRDPILAVTVLFAIGGAFLVMSVISFVGRTWPMELLVDALRRGTSG